MSVSQDKPVKMYIRQKEKESEFTVIDFPVESEENMQRCLALLKTAIQEIQNKSNPTSNSDELHRSTFTLVLHGHGERLYNTVKEVLTQHVETKVKEEVLKSLKEDNFLEALNEAWKEHQATISKIGYFLMYMDMHYVQQNSVDNVRNFGARIFKQKVYDEIRKHLREILLNMVEEERKEKDVDSLALKSACQMMVALGVGSRYVYQEDLEFPYLQKAVSLYKVRGQELLKNSTAIEYVIEVEKIINDEEKRARQYLDDSSGSEVVRVLEEELIGNHLTTVVEKEDSGVVFLVKNGLTEKLDRVLKVLSRVPNGRETVEQYIQRYEEEELLRLKKKHEEEEELLRLKKKQEEEEELLRLKKKQEEEEELLRQKKKREEEEELLRLKKKQDEERFENERKAKMNTANLIRKDLISTQTKITETKIGLSIEKQKTTEIRNGKTVEQEKSNETRIGKLIEKEININTKNGTFIVQEREVSSSKAGGSPTEEKSLLDSFVQLPKFNGRDSSNMPSIVPGSVDGKKLRRNDERQTGKGKKPR